MDQRRYGSVIDDRGGVCVGWLLVRWLVVRYVVVCCLSTVQRIQMKISWANLDICFWNLCFWSLPPRRPRVGNAQNCRLPNLTKSYVL